MERIRYTLRHPIPTKVGDEGSNGVVTELQLAPRVKGRHMRATDNAKGPVEAKLLLIASLAGIPRSEADELDQEDILAIDALYAEDSDLDLVADALGLPAGSPPQLVIDAIHALKRENLNVPLDGGAARSPDGPATGGPSSAT